MNNELLNETEWILGGISEKSENKESLIESLTRMIGIFNSLDENSNDFHIANKLGIIDEVSQLEDIFESIRTKLDTELNEDFGAVAFAVPAMASLVAGVSAGLLKKWMADGSVLPAALEGSFNKIGAWLKSSDKILKYNKRNELIKEFEKKMPNASPMQIRNLVDNIEKNYVSEKKYHKPTENSAKEGTYHTEFSRAFKNRQLTKDELKKRFPNMGTKK